MGLAVWLPSDRLGAVQGSRRHTNHIKNHTTSVLADASTKLPDPAPPLELPLSLLEVVHDTKAEMEALRA